MSNLTFPCKMLQHLQVNSVALRHLASSCYWDNCAIRKEYFSLWQISAFTSHEAPYTNSLHSTPCQNRAFTWHLTFDTVSAGLMCMQNLSELKKILQILQNKEKLFFPYQWKQHGFERYSFK